MRSWSVCGLTFGVDFLSMFISFTFWLSVVALLIAYLCFSVGRRWVTEEARRRSAETRVRGTAFDASTIAPQLERVRQDHLAVVHAQPHQTPFHLELIAVARRMVANLRYFRHARQEHEVRGNGG